VNAVRAGAREPAPERMMRDAKITQIDVGTNAIQRFVTAGRLAQ
jgi:alkylation response protein AidB-like acyl-CoA dehydrogenase